MKQITIREFIEKELCGSIEQTKGKFPYFAFGAIVNAIELLGNCMDSCDWNQTRLSKKHFNNAIKTLPSLKISDRRPLFKLTLWNDTYNSTNIFITFSR